MARVENITLRPVEASDLEIFRLSQLDAEAIRMAAFVGKDHGDKAVFAALWARILHEPRITNRTIVAGGRVAGNIACHPQGIEVEVTYWLGREFWGRGIATQALRLMLDLVRVSPLLARAAVDNVGSIRVLQKCGFKIIGSNRDFAHGRGQVTEEYILRLDRDQSAD